MFLPLEELVPHMMILHQKVVAEAFNKKYEMNKEAFNILEKYYPEGEFNESRQRMAKMPSDVQLIYNPMTAAPGFILNNVYVLPGVPKIMEVMFINVLKNIKKGKPKKVVTINTNLYESKLAPYLKDIQKNIMNVQLVVIHILTFYPKLVVLIYQYHHGQ